MAGKNPRVLIVDDEPVVCDLLHEGLSERGYLCTAVLNGNDALAKLAKEDFDVVLLDIRLPGMSGMDVLREIWLNHSNTAAIMITAIKDVDTAVEAMKLGASDYIVKPFDLDRVEASIHTTLETKPAADKPPTELDAIAHGIEAKLDSLTLNAWVVTQRTTGIARQLGIAEEEIQRWITARTELDTKRGKIIKSGQ